MIKRVEEKTNFFPPQTKTTMLLVSLGFLLVFSPLLLKFYFNDTIKEISFLRKIFKIGGASMIVGTVTVAIGVIVGSMSIYRAKHIPEESTFFARLFTYLGALYIGFVIVILLVMAQFISGIFGR